MAKKVIKVKVVLNVKGVAGALLLLMGVWVHHAQPYALCRRSN